MKQGNQFYLEIEIYDENDNFLDDNSVKEIQFNIGELTKKYDKVNQDVTYENNKYKIWLTEQETFNFEDITKYDVRVKFKNDVILGSYINNFFVADSLKKIEMGD